MCWLQNVTLYGKKSKLVRFRINLHLNNKKAINDNATAIMYSVSYHKKKNCITVLSQESVAYHYQWKKKKKKKCNRGKKIEN